MLSQIFSRALAKRGLLAELSLLSVTVSAPQGIIQVEGDAGPGENIRAVRLLERMLRDLMHLGGHEKDAFLNIGPISRVLCRMSLECPSNLLPLIKRRGWTLDWHSLPLLAARPSQAWHDVRTFSSERRQSA